MGEIIGLIIGGVIVGALGRLINPGPDPMGWIVTIAIGIGAMLLVGLLIGGVIGFILAVVVAAVLVTVVQKVLPGRDRRVTT
ncbi:MAG: GlsB/YeaQ/YmgE family stress response membrane protein [Actinomycetota bacterium]|nr:GlsB/YeaQ/YmgE family stress response membrane protein [Actinomycetota bacterium]